MNRRDFLKGFAVASAGALLLPERRIFALDHRLIKPDVSLVPVQIGYYDPITGRGGELATFQSTVTFGDHGYYQVDYSIDPGGIIRPAFTTNVDAKNKLSMEEFLNGIQPAYNASIGYN